MVDHISLTVLWEMTDRFVPVRFESSARFGLRALLLAGICSALFVAAFVLALLLIFAFEYWGH